MEYRNALITGASSGLGRGLAAWFANRGTRVFAAARRTELLESLRQQYPAAIEPVEMDVAQAAPTIERIRALDQSCGGLDLVIANAGVGEDTHAKHLRWEAVERIIEVNVKGAAATLSAALPAMVERGRGHLVGVSSIAAFRGLPGSAAYCASKAFVGIFLEGLRVDLAGTGVLVTSLHPGFVKTEMTAKNRFQMPFLLEVEEAVTQMGEAIERGQAVRLFPWPLAMAMQAMKAMPSALYQQVARRLR
jgi:short-subunit dehydrogenase